MTILSVKQPSIILGTKAFRWSSNFGAVRKEVLKQSAKAFFPASTVPRNPRHQFRKNTRKPFGILRNCKLETYCYIFVNNSKFLRKFKRKIHVFSANFGVSIVSYWKSKIKNFQKFNRNTWNSRSSCCIFAVSEIKGWHPFLQPRFKNEELYKLKAQGCRCLNFAINFNRLTMILHLRM